MARVGSRGSAVAQPGLQMKVVAIDGQGGGGGREEATEEEEGRR